MKPKIKKERGITLIALVVTIIVLLILAGVSISMLTGQNGIIAKAIEANERTAKAKAREKLEVVFAEAIIPKRMDPTYNENKYLDKMITDRIEDCSILKNDDLDIVIVEKWAFLIDRSIPKIVDEIGKKEDIIYPEITLNEKLADDEQSADIIIEAKENKNGIKMIEIIQDGNVLKTFEYDNQKEVKETYNTEFRGTYIVKVYSKFSAEKDITISDIYKSLKFVPEGDTTYKKSHTAQINSDESVIITNIKYLWSNSSDKPDETSFIQTCNLNQNITCSEGTGPQYLYILTETSTKRKRIERSEAFYFDNEGPTIMASTFEKELEYNTSGVLPVTIDDEGVGTLQGYYLTQDENEEINSENVSTIPWTSCDVGNVNIAIPAVTAKNTTYYLWVADSVGNVSERKEIKLRTDYIEAKDITADYIKDNVVVDYVEYTTTELLKDRNIRNKKFNTWQILYADSDNIYLISQWGVNKKCNRADYSEGIEMLKDTTRFQAIGKGWHAPMSNANYSNADVSEALYRLDKQNWESFLGDMGEWALGGPTLEMFVASYDKVKGTNYRSKIIVNDTGYEIPNELNSKYSIGSETVLNNGENYHLACVGNTKNSVAFYAVKDNLTYGLTTEAWESYYGGSRVVVCLKSEAKLIQDKETGHYIVK